MSERPNDTEHDRPDDERDPRADAGSGASSQPGDEEDVEEGEKLVLTAPDAAATPRDLGLWAGVLLLFALAIYGPALRGQFLWDDDRHVSHNPGLRDVDGLAKIWFTPKTTPQYYPLTHTTYWIESQFARRADGTFNTLVFHVTNVVLHTMGAVLLWFILRKLQVPGAWLAAAVFAVHPVHVESVAWISERKNVLSGAFFFGSILAYLAFANVGGPILPARATDEDASRTPPEPVEPAPRWDLYALALGLFVCALLSKTVTCSMPAVVLLLIWWKRGGVKGRDWALLAPFFAVGVALALVTILMERGHVIDEHYKFGDWNIGLVERVLIAGRAVWFYLTKLLVPVNLTFTYPRWEISAGDAVQWLYPIGVVAALAVLWALRGRIGRAPLVAALIYVGVLVPALGFFDIYPMRYSFVADHFQYHASAAMIALIVGSLALLARRAFPVPEAAEGGTAEVTGGKATVETDESPLAARPSDVDAGDAAGDDDEAQPSPLPYVLAGVLLAALCVQTWRHARVFDNPIALYEDTIAKNPGAWMANNNLSAEYYDAAMRLREEGGQEQRAQAQELLVGAVAAADQAIQLRDNYALAHFNKGRALHALGQRDAAMPEYDRAIAIDADVAMFHFQRGVLLEESEKFPDALASFTEAVRLNPDNPVFLRSQGLMLEANGNEAEAEKTYRRAMELAPNFLPVRNDYATLLARQGRSIEAAKEYNFIIRRNPEAVDARINLAMLQMMAGNLQDSRQHLGIATMIFTERRQTPPKKLVEAIQMWDKAMDAVEAAATQPTTTRAATQPSATAPAAAAAAPIESSPPTTAPAAP